MSMHVLYVEDDQLNQKSLLRSFKRANKIYPKRLKVNINMINHPRYLKDALRKFKDIDIVLADVYFDDPEVDKLDEIIRCVIEWDKMSPNGFTTAIIVYTHGGEKTLKRCYDLREYLYDIWNKTSASPEYVFWRIQELQTFLPRNRPDVTIQKEIANMDSKSCPIWHKQVLQLAKSYGEGQTEREQIRNCEQSIRNIFESILPGKSSPYIELWDALVESEPLLRAVSRNLRGISRHSINVFWLGYWIINNKKLKNNFSDLWSDMIRQREYENDIKIVDPNLMLNSTWAIASLLHDSGKYYEYGKATIEKFNSYFGKFNSLGTGKPEWKRSIEDSRILEIIKPVINMKNVENENKMKGILEKYIKNGLEMQKPDHGTISAAYLLSIFDSMSNIKSNKIIIYEAARSMLIHSCLPDTYKTLSHNDINRKYLKIGWNSDVIACLLILCDQIQTWDRSNTEDENREYPDRAELSSIEILTKKNTKRQIINYWIDYIAPSSIDMYPLNRKIIADELTRTIQTNPKNALYNIIKEDTWPFNVNFGFSLSGDKLDLNIEIP